MNCEEGTRLGQIAAFKHDEESQTLRLSTAISSEFWLSYMLANRYLAIGDIDSRVPLVLLRKGSLSMESCLACEYLRLLKGKSGYQINLIF
jgi:hypothetical protein